MFDGREMRSFQTTIKFILSTREASLAQEAIAKSGRVPTVKEVERASRQRSDQVEYPTQIPKRE